MNFRKKSEKNKAKNKEKKNRKFNFKRIVGTISKKHIKNGSYSMIMTVVFVAAVIVINMIVGEIPSKYTQIDMSESGLYSIGDETKKALKELDKDVTIYQIAQSGYEDENISAILKRYEDESEHIKVELKDPVVNPKFVSDYTSEQISSNSLIVESGERSKIIKYSDIYESSIDYNTYSYQTTGFDGEGQITSAIGYVTSENLPVLYTLEGHGEKTLSTDLKDSIEKANIEVKELNLLTEENVPEDAECLMIISPSTDISSSEKDAVLKYLENGGKAMIFSDYTEEDLQNFDALLENYGIKRVEGLVFEGDAQHYAMQMPYYLVPSVESTEASSQASSSDYLTLAPFAQGIQKLDDVRDTVKIESILTTSDSAYSKTDMNSTQIEKEEGDVDGPFDIGVSITESLDEENETKIVYYTTANLIDSQVNQMVSGGNQQLITESLKWMVDTEESASVSIPSKSLQAGSLSLTEYDASFWKIWVIGIIPGAFLVIGFMIWFKRRKA